MVFLPHWPKPGVIRYDDSLNLLLQILGQLGNPHLSLKNVIHIAGTNGKGSTVAMLKAILENAGYKVHSFTSPHLLECNERIVISGEKISDTYLFSLLEQIRIINQQFDRELGFFHAMTAAAFLAFAHQPSDFIILETGLGGEKDPTNLIPAPLLTIITPISYDHQNVLGPTLKNITYAKAGIIKPNVPCIISAQIEEVTELLLRKCSLLGAEAVTYEYDYLVQNNGDNFAYKDSQQRSLLYTLPHLPGYHQAINSACVIAAIYKITEILNLNIREQIIQNALAEAAWAGRMHKIAANNYPTLPPDITFWLDGAHNEAGAVAISEWIKDKFKLPIQIILGMTKKRDIITFIKHFAALTSHVYTVTVKTEASSYSGETLAAEVAKIIPCTACDDLDEALSKIRKIRAGEEVLVTGSLFLVADFLSLINNKR